MPGIECLPRGSVPAVDVTPAIRRRDLLLDASRDARERGDIIRANCYARDARLVCYMWDLPIPDEAVEVAL